MLKERDEDTRRAGTAVRTVPTVVKDVRLQRQPHSAQADSAQTMMNPA